MHDKLKLTCTHTHNQQNSPTHSAPPSHPHPHVFAGNQTLYQISKRGHLFFYDFLRRTADGDSVYTYMFRKFS